MSRAEYEEFFLLLALIGALSLALGPIGPVLALTIYFLLRSYYCGFPE